MYTLICSVRILLHDALSDIINGWALLCTEMYRSKTSFPWFHYLRFSAPRMDKSMLIVCNLPSILEVGQSRSYDPTYAIYTRNGDI